MTVAFQLAQVVQSMRVAVSVLGFPANLIPTYEPEDLPKHVPEDLTENVA